MDFFRIINDIAAETRMNMCEKVQMLIRILVGISPKRIECRRRAGPEGGEFQRPRSANGKETNPCGEETGSAGLAVNPHQGTR